MKAKDLEKKWKTLYIELSETAYTYQKKKVVEERMGTFKEP